MMMTTHVKVTRRVRKFAKYSSEWTTTGGSVLVAIKTISKFCSYCEQNKKSYHVKHRTQGCIALYGKHGNHHHKKVVKVQKI